MSCGSTTCTSSPTQSLRPADPAPLHLPSPVESIAAWFAALVRLQIRWRRREELHDLEDRTLRDVGLTREQIEGGAHRPFWR